VAEEARGMLLRCPLCGQTMKHPTVPAPAPPPEAIPEVRPAPPKGRGPLECLSRRYRHLACNAVTIGSGDDLVLLECPFRPLGGGTFCVRCKTFVPLSSVVWEDTGENIEEYRDRLYKSVPWKRRMYLSWFGNAYEGALNLRLDKRGNPLPPETDAK